MKLELARTLFLLGRYSESRALFKQVSLDPATPWQVRDNVNAYLARIDEAQGYAHFAVSVVSDSNPRNITSQREFVIGGFRLTFVPPEDNRRVTGLRYAVQAMYPLDRPSQISAYFTGSYLDYPNDTFDRLTVDLGLAKGIDSAGRWRVRGGVEAGTFGGRSLYNFPYLALGYVVSQSATHRVSTEARVGHVEFPNSGFLDAAYTGLTLSALRIASSTVALGLNAGLERSNSAEAAFSYTGETIGPTLSWLITDPALLVKTELALGKRDYEAPDPFFGAQRSDRKTRFDFSVQSKEWRLFNFNPALVLSLEHTRSSLEFYSYDKVNFSLALE